MSFINILKNVQITDIFSKIYTVRAKSNYSESKKEIYYKKILIRRK